MKKAFITLGIISIVFAWFTYASNTKPLTPAQKRIQAIKLAKLKKQQVKVNTGTVNTWNISTGNCVIPVFTWSFTWTNESIYTQISDSMTIVKKNMYNLNNNSCIQYYNDNINTYNNWIEKFTKIMNDNYFAFMRDKINRLSKTLVIDDEKYNECTEFNKTVPYYDRKDCWFDPVILFTDLDTAFNSWKKENNYK